MRWVWLAIAGALVLWLAVLLLISGPDADERQPAPGARDRVRNETFDSPGAGVFSKRHPVKAERPLPAFPTLPDQRKRE